VRTNTDRQAIMVIRLKPLAAPAIASRICARDPDSNRPTFDPPGRMVALLAMEMLGRSAKRNKRDVNRPMSPCELQE